MQHNEVRKHSNSSDRQLPSILPAGPAHPIHDVRQQSFRTAPKSATTSSPTTRRSRCGRRTRSNEQVAHARRRRSAAAAGRRGPARPVPAHPVLPQALPLLLLPRLHRQERDRGAGAISTCSPASGSSTTQQAAIAGRPLNFVYFGGGTPSYISTRQLESLVSRMDAVSSWRSAEEITFECEPGTLTEEQARGDPRHRRHPAQPRRRELRRCDPRGQRAGAPVAGDRTRLRVRAVARLSADQHRSHRRHARRDRRELAAPACEKTIDMAPDSVTIYQMELPFNTTISRNLLTRRRTPFRARAWPNWSTKRRWVQEAFEALEARRLHDRIGVHGGEESVDEVHLSRSALAGRRHGRPGRRVVRPRQRRAHAEPRHVRGVLQRSIEPGRCRWPARSGRRRRAVHPRVRAAAQAGLDSAVVLRSASTASDVARRAFSAQLAALAGEGLLDGRPRPRGAHPRRAAARGQPAAALLQARAQRRFDTRSEFEIQDCRFKIGNCCRARLSTHSLKS